MIQLDIGILVTVSLAIVSAWWAMAKMFVSQFEKRQNERFADLQKSMTDQKSELDTHMGKQDVMMTEIRRVEAELARSQVDAANRFQTRAESSTQYQGIINELRSLGNRIDALLQHNGNGSTQ